MAGKLVVSNGPAREALRQGVDALSAALAVTYGPLGGNVGLGLAHHRRPLLTRDGAAVARELAAPDPVANLGVRLLRDAVLRTGDAAGDGTTLAAILAQALIDEGLRAIAAGAEPMALRRGIEAAAGHAARCIKEQAIPIAPHDGDAWRTTIAAVAASAAHDEALGQIVAIAFERAAAAGGGGSVAVELGKGRRPEVVAVAGGQFECGYVSPYFITDFSRREAVVEEPYILVTREKVARHEDVVPLLESLLQLGKKHLVVVAEEITGDALATLVVNRLRGTMKLLAVRLAGDDAQRLAAFDDLCALTGATLIAPETGKRLALAFIGDLGRAERVVATQQQLTVIGGKGKPERLAAAARWLEAELQQAQSEVRRALLRRRLSRLSGGLVVIRAGGATEAEAQEQKGRLERAVSAARAALEEGIVPGGGIALLNAQAAVDRLLDGGALSGDEAWGARIVRRALEAPLRRLAQNAGYSGSAVVEAVRQHQRHGSNTRIGFDVLRGDYADLVDRGVVDPAKVVRLALEHAASAAGTLLTVEAAVVPLPRAVSA
jgi:chaperonin GroEL